MTFSTSIVLSEEGLRPRKKINVGYLSSFFGQDGLILTNSLFRVFIDRETESKSINSQRKERGY